MLVLSRKVGESVKIGDAVVTIVRIDDGRIRIGIDAPPNVKILRTELPVLADTKPSKVAA